MTRPLPETKFNELADAINALKVDEVLSEFKYARLKRLLASLIEILPYDQYQILNAIIELHNNKIFEAYKIASEVFLISETLYVLEQIVYIFDKVFSVNKSIEVLNKIAEISKKLDLNLKEIMPPCRELIIAFNDHEGAVRFDWQNLPHEQVVNINDLKYAFKRIEINYEYLEKINNIVHNLLIQNNVRCISTEYFSMDDDLLFLFYVDESIEFISQLNDSLLDACINENILEFIYQLSYSFVPYDGENENE